MLVVLACLYSLRSCILCVLVFLYPFVLVSFFIYVLVSFCWCILSRIAFLYPLSFPVLCILVFAYSVAVVHAFLAVSVLTRSKSYYLIFSFNIFFVCFDVHKFCSMARFNVNSYQPGTDRRTAASKLSKPYRWYLMPSLTKQFHFSTKCFLSYLIACHLLLDWNRVDPNVSPSWVREGPICATCAKSVLKEKTLYFDEDWVHFIIFTYVRGGGQEVPRVLWRMNQFWWPLSLSLLSLYSNLHLRLSSSNFKNFKFQIQNSFHYSFIQAPRSPVPFVSSQKYHEFTRSLTTHHSPPPASQRPSLFWILQWWLQSRHQSKLPLLVARLNLQHIPALRVLLLSLQKMTLCSTWFHSAITFPFPSSSLSRTVSEIW